jgi:ribosome-associated protein
LDSKKLAFKLADLALTKKAEDILVMDLRKLTTVADFFVICSAGSEPQVKAIADAVLEGAKKMEERVWHKEGTNMKQWVLLDFVDVVVHIFMRDTRKFYSLEKLWGDADISSVSDEPPKLLKKNTFRKGEKPDAAKPKSKIAAKKKSAAKPKAAAKTKSAAKPKAKPIKKTK